MEPLETSFYGIPSYALLWMLTVLALGVFGWRVSRLVGVLRHARRENRLDRPFERLKLFATYVLGQRRLLRERIGIAHFFFFWGFVLFAGTFWWALVYWLCLVLPIPYPEQIRWLNTLLDVFAAVVIVSLIAAAIRRALFPPPHLHVSADAYIILGLIGTLMATYLVGEGFSIVASPREHMAWTPAGTYVAWAFSDFDPAVAREMAVVMWWCHMTTVLGFLAYLPYSKHLHLLVAPFNVFFGNVRPKGDLGILGEDVESMGGAKFWSDFTWRQLLNSFACAECGRCDRICVAADGDPNDMSPQTLVQGIKEHLLEAALGEKKTGAAGDGGEARALIGGMLPKDMVWKCATCGACMEQCPVLNEHVPLVVQIRRALVSEGSVSKTLQDALTNMTRYGNSFGKGGRLRSKWTKGLDFKIPDARKEAVDYVWFVGDYASFDPRTEETTRTTAKLLKLAGLNFGLLYEGEHNSGNDVRRVGEEGLFQMLRDKNRESFSRSQFVKIITTDPHSYNTLKNEYPPHSEGSDEKNDAMKDKIVLHVVEVFDELLRHGKLKVRRPLNRAATFHDPCYLGRYNGVYEPPRRVLRALGLNLVEMPRNRSRSVCCGAGGGRIWQEDQSCGEERPAESRVREAAALPGVEILVVACPKDLVMFQDALKTTGNEGNLVIRDLSDLVWEAVHEGREKETEMAGASERGQSKEG